MRLKRVGAAMVAVLGLAGCQTNGGQGGAQPVADSPEAALARCVENTRRLNPYAMQTAREIMRVKTDAEAAPLLCRRLAVALAAGRLGPEDLSWDDSARPMSKRLVRALQGR